MFQLRNLFSKMNHDRVTSWKIFLQKFSITKFELHFESAPEHLLLAPLSRIIFSLNDVSFPHLVPSVIQHHLDLLISWVLTTFVQRNPSTLIDALLAVEVGRIDADEPLGV